jgi:hypothetical protein
MRKNLRKSIFLLSRNFLYTRCMPHIESLDWNLHTHIALDLDETLALSMQDGLDKLHALGKMQNIRTPADITDFLWENIEGSDMTNEELYAFWHTHQLGNVSPIT